MMTKVQLEEQVVKSGLEVTRLVHDKERLKREAEKKDEAIRDLKTQLAELLVDNSLKQGYIDKVIEDDNVQRGVLEDNGYQEHQPPAVLFRRKGPGTFSHSVTYGPQFGNREPDHPWWNK